jgi:hypothetical protein
MVVWSSLIETIACVKIGHDVGLWLGIYWRGLP